MHSLQDPAIPLLDSHPAEMKTYVHEQTFVAAILMAAETETTKMSFGMSTDEQLCASHETLVGNKNNLQPLKWLRDIMVNKIKKNYIWYGFIYPINYNKGEQIGDAGAWLIME